MSTTSGWGRFTWGQAYWNENDKLGAGWGAQTWNHGAWYDLNDVTISVTGLQIETDLGIEGWGNNLYGRGAWGEFAVTVGLGADVSVSGVSFSAATTAFTDFSDVTYSSASFTANGAMIYNTTTDGGSGTTDAVCIIAFGGDKTASNGTFKIEFPTADSSSAIIRLA